MLRFTDTLKWRDPLWKSLSLEMKLFYQYLLDDCDRAGYWIPELEVASARLGFSVTQEKALSALKPVLKICADGCWHIKTHLQLQFPKGFSEKNNFHRAVLRDLKTRESMEKISHDIADPPANPVQPGKPVPVLVKQYSDSLQPESPDRVSEQVRAATPDDVPPTRLRDGGGDGDVAGDGDGTPPEGSGEGGAGGTPGAVEIVQLVLNAFDALGAPQDSKNVAPFTVSGLVSGFNRHGPGLWPGIKVYVKRRREQRKGVSLKHFADHLDEYVPGIPRKEVCRHDWRDYDEKVTDFQFGPVVKMRRCSRCKVAQPKHGTREASVSKQVHVCDWEDVEGMPAVLAGSVTRSGLDGKQICKLCGDLRDKQLEAGEE